MLCRGEGGNRDLRRFPTVAPRALDLGDQGHGAQRVCHTDPSGCAELLSRGWPRPLISWCINYFVPPLSPKAGRAESNASCGLLVITSLRGPGSFFVSSLKQADADHLRPEGMPRKGAVLAADTRPECGSLEPSLSSGRLHLLSLVRSCKSGLGSIRSLPGC